MLIWYLTAFSSFPTLLIQIDWISASAHAAEGYPPALCVAWMNKLKPIYSNLRVTLIVTRTRTGTCTTLRPTFVLLLGVYCSPIFIEELSSLTSTRTGTRTDWDYSTDSLIWWSVEAFGDRSASRSQTHHSNSQCRSPVILALFVPVRHWRVDYLYLYCTNRYHTVPYEYDNLSTSTSTVWTLPVLVRVRMY